MNRSEWAKHLLDIDIRALEHLRENVPGCLDATIDAMAERIRSGNKILISGVGKSFHIAQKMAATMASTGTPAIVLHPAEAMHGDLGLLQQGDMLIALSYSGETEELLTLLPFANQLDCLIISITGNSESSLGLASNYVLPVPIDQEACPFNLAPTTSALVTLAMGDILAMLLHQTMGFTEADYARLHPGGAIGNAIYLKISDIMRTGDRITALRPKQSVQEAMFCMTQCRTGALAVVDEAEHVIGIVTDGDIRRHLVEHPTAMDALIDTVMTPDPASVEQSKLAVELVKLFETRNINDVVIVDQQGKLAGMVDIQDMPKAKLL